MALTMAGSKNVEAAAFYRFLQSPGAKAVLSKYGFPGEVILYARLHAQ